MLLIFDFNQSKNNSIYSYGIINIIWYYSNKALWVFEQQLEKREVTVITIAIKR
jgi:hypothetical protein